jgi:hypothetical protein
MKTHKVLDLHYHPEEGQGCFDGTLQECEEWAATQSPQFMYKVVPMTTDEIRLHPDNQVEIKGHSLCMQDYLERQKCNQK